MRNTTSAVFRTYQDGETWAMLFNERNEDGETKAYSLKKGYFYADLECVMKYTQPATQKQYKAVFAALRQKYDAIRVYQRARVHVQEKKKDTPQQRASSPHPRHGGWESDKIAAFSRDQVLVGVFASMTQAAKFIGVRVSSVRFAVVGDTVACQGWYLRRVDETLSMDEIGTLTLQDFDRRIGEKRLTYPHRAMRKTRAVSKD